ncbi:MAG: hypothetical protein AAGM38_11490 [Pseudomonadota bacterium]
MNAPPASPEQPQAAPAQAERALAGPPSPRERAPTLPQDLVSAWIVVVTAALMGFLAALGIAISYGADSLADSWTGTLERRATVVLEAPFESAERSAQEIASAVKALRAVDGVRAATPISEEDTAALLAPWLDEAEESFDAAQIARMIDLTLAAGGRDPDGQAAIAGARAALEAAGVEASVDAHGEWIDRLTPAAERVRAFAWAALIVVMAASGLMIALACWTAMSAQAHIIDVLRLVGAYDSYIAGLFMRRFQILAFIGAAIGAGVAAAALLSAPIGAAPQDPAARLAPLLPSLAPDSGLIARLALTPLGFALVATLAARLAVEMRLRRSEG